MHKILNFEKRLDWPTKNNIIDYSAKTLIQRGLSPQFVWNQIESYMTSINSGNDTVKFFDDTRLCGINFLIISASGTHVEPEKESAIDQVHKRKAWLINALNSDLDNLSEGGKSLLEDLTNIC